MRWITVMLAILLISCTNNTKVPAGIIQRPKMEKVLWEMVEADRFNTSFIQSRKDTLGRNKRETIDTYDKVFSYNGITRDEFISSYKFYMSRPDLLKSMFDSISSRGDRKRAEVYNHPRPNTHLKTDSLRHKADSIHNAIKHKNDSVAKKILPKPPSPRLP